MQKYIKNTTCQNIYAWIRFKKRLSNSLDSQKTLKNARRRSTKCENREKTLVVGRRNAEIAEKCPSSVDEMQKSLENARRRPTKCRKRKKQPVVGRRNAEIAEKCSSSADEMQDLPRIIRHPWMKTKKRQKMPGIRGWKWENDEKWLSAMADE